MILDTVVDATYFSYSIAESREIYLPTMHQLTNLLERFHIQRSDLE
jgi:hypothetical protein